MFPAILNSRRRYFGNVIAPPPPGDPYSAYVSLLLHMDGINGGTSFPDETGKTVTPHGLVTTSTLQQKFGPTSALFVTSGDWLSVVADASLEFGAGNYTIEGWAYNDTGGGEKCLIDFRSAGIEGVGIYLTSTFAGGISFAVNNNIGSICYAPSSALPASTWVHWAIVRTGTTILVFVDGALVATGTDARTYGTGAGVVIGANSAGAQSVSAYVDDLRVTKGIARYTAAFVPPTAPFPYP
jgi:hypothetical protein